MSRKIVVVGLGAGDIDQLPLGIYRKLLKSENLFLRTKEHPVVSELEKDGVVYKSFDHVYEKHGQFEAVYQEIVDVLLQESLEKEIIYAVPGHPLVAEKTVQLLLDHKSNSDDQILIEGGQSFIDSLFTALEIDPIEGFQFVDALSMDRDALQFTQHLLVCQVYDRFIASEVKLTLMELLPDDYEVFIVTAAGSNDQNIRKVPLFELDHDLELNNLTSLYIPPVKEEALTYHDFRTFRKIIAALRGSGGCPWDQKQTHQSLKKYLLEEAYELIEAIDDEDDNHIIEELGDVLLQVVLHAQIGEDDGMFTIEDVIRGVSEKMIRRHPHVFEDVHAEDAEAVVKNWDKIKQEEKSGVEKAVSLLDTVPNSLPGLMKAYQYQHKAAKVGFDWKTVKPMWEKIQEEINEFKGEITKSNIATKYAAMEFGDLLFALVNIARFYEIDPEEAIMSTNKKFYNRFRYIEEQVSNRGLKINTLSLQELDAFWEDAKKREL